MAPVKKWWQTATIYEIYPSSFKDSNGDGIGDIQGIISKIGYLASLGIDAVWLAACYESGGVDVGYDVANYRQIDARYGTVQDVEDLIAELKEHNIRLIMDLVVNHTSNKHVWFKESRSSTNSSKRDWYFWRRGTVARESDGELKRYPPNNWESIFKGSAWEYDEHTDEWYLGVFSKEQPDLNWDNPEVRQAVYEDMRFWLDKGVAGFRMDVINMISKPPTLPDAPIRNPNSLFQCAEDLHCNGPKVHEYLREMNEQVVSKYSGVMTVGEIICTREADKVREYTDPERNELCMAYTYDLFGLDIGPNGKFSPGQWKLSEFKKFVKFWQTELAFSRGSWQANWLESHDTGRCVTRFGDRNSENREKVAKMLAMLESTLGGTLFIYQGQELGIVNLSNDIPVAAYPDVETKRILNAMLQARADKTGVAKDEVDMSDVIAEVRLKARDHARNPLPWVPASKGDPHAGFSSASASVPMWSPMNMDSRACNIESQATSVDSVLNFWRKRLAVRKKYPETLVYGNFEVITSTVDDTPVFAYWRTPLSGVQTVQGKGIDGTRPVLVVLNMTSQEGIEFEMPIGYDFFVLDSTTSTFALSFDGARNVTLEAYESVVFGY